MPILRHLFNFISFILPPTHCFGIRNLLLRLSGIKLGNDAKICGQGWIYGRGALSIGEKCWLSPRIIIHTHIDAPIKIEPYCDIGPSAEFIPGGHEIGSAERRAGTGTARSIFIGRGTWIGAGVRILGGVNIGEGCVIAAGAVVVNNIPPHSLAAGVPALVKRNLNDT